MGLGYDKINKSKSCRHIIKNQMYPNNNCTGHCGVKGICVKSIRLVLISTRGGMSSCEANCFNVFSAWQRSYHHHPYMCLYEKRTTV